MKTIDQMTETELRELSKKLGIAIKEILPTATGFTVLFWAFGGKAGGNYISNANRQDMIKALREVADRLENKEDIPR